jgi:hypothetical protein
MLSLGEVVMAKYHSESNVRGVIMVITVALKGYRDLAGKRSIWPGIHCVAGISFYSQSKERREKDETDQQTDLM